MIFFPFLKERKEKKQHPLNNSHFYSLAVAGLDLTVWLWHYVYSIVLKSKHLLNVYCDEKECRLVVENVQSKVVDESNSQRAHIF